MFAIVMAAAVAVVASPTPSPAASPVPEIAHVVTSARSDEAISRATRVTYVVTRDQIVRDGYRTIGDALSAVPGVEIENYGAIGANQSYGIRGSSSAQVLVLVNGLPAPGSLANSVNLGTFSTAGVARIEVVEGGGSTLYGAGAIGGVINIITAGAPSSGASLRLGSFGDRQLQVSAGGFSVERIVATNDYSLPAYALGAMPAPVSRQNSAYRSTTVRYGGQRSFGALEAQVDVSLDSSSGGTPGYFPYVSNSGRQDEVDRASILTLRTRGRHATTTLQLGETLQQFAFSCSLAADPISCGQYSPSLSVESRVNFGLRDAVDAGRQRLLYGIDLSRGTVNTNTGGSTLPVPPSETPPPVDASAALAQTALYVEDTADLNSNLRAHAGVRGERDGARGGEVSPSIGIEQRLSPSLAIKMNYANAFRAPDASELYYPGYGNPALRPERARVGDVTLAASLGQADLTFGWFSNRTNDLIVPVLIKLIKVTPSQYIYVYQPQNIDRALMQGFTLNVATHAYRGLRVGLDATDLYRALDVTAGTRLPNDPVFTVNMSLTIAAAATGAFGGAGISQRFVGNRGPVDYSQPLFFQPVAYANLGAYVDLRVTPRLDLFVRGFNLGNERYAEIAGYPMPGRAFAIELRTK